MKVISNINTTVVDDLSFESSVAIEETVDKSQVAIFISNMMHDKFYHGGDGDYIDQIQLQLIASGYKNTYRVIEYEKAIPESKQQLIQDEKVIVLEPKPKNPAADSPLKIQLS